MGGLDKNKLPPGRVHGPPGSELTRQWPLKSVRDEYGALRTQKLERKLYRA